MTVTREECGQINHYLDSKLEPMLSIVTQEWKSPQLIGAVFHTFASLINGRRSRNIQNRNGKEEASQKYCRLIYLILLSLSTSHISHCLVFSESKTPKHVPFLMFIHKYLKLFIFLKLLFFCFSRF